jgi:mRNA interferase MazF
MVVARGEIWWGEAPDEKGRPYLVVSRDSANLAMARVLVAPVTTRVRAVPSELPLGAAEGLPRPSAASFDNLQSFPQAMLTRRLGALPGGRRHELCAVAAATLDC